MCAADEIQAVVSLWRNAGLAHPWNDPERDIRLALDHPTATILVARHMNGGLIGTVMAGFDGHRGWLYSLAVAQEFRGSGAGASLVAAAEQWLRERGAPVARLLVEENNEAVCGFYERLGYSRGGFIAFGKQL